MGLRRNPPELDCLRHPKRTREGHGMHTARVQQLISPRCSRGLCGSKPKFELSECIHMTPENLR